MTSCSLTRKVASFEGARGRGMVEGGEREIEELEDQKKRAERQKNKENQKKKKKMRKSEGVSFKNWIVVYFLS